MKKMTNCHIKVPHFYSKQRSRFIFKHLMFKKSLKRFITEYLPELELLYHKHNPLMTTVVYKSTFFKKTFKTIT